MLVQGRAIIDGLQVLTLKIMFLASEPKRGVKGISPSKKPHRRTKFEARLYLQIGINE